MKQKLFYALAVILIVCNQACKKKEENPGPQVKQINNIVMADDKLIDLTDGSAYSSTEAMGNESKIDANYSKALTFTDTQTGKDTTLKSVLLSAEFLSLNGTSSLPNKTTFAPVLNGKTLDDVTYDQLKTMYDEAVTAFSGDTPLLSGVPANIIIMFKIRNNTNSPKYGGIKINSFTADSLAANVSITVQE